MEGGIFSSLFVPPIERKRKGDSMNRYQLLDKENLQFISEEEFISDFLIKDCEVKNIEEKIFISNCIVENVVFTECNLDKIDIYKTKYCSDIKIYELAKSVDVPEADAVLILCTGVRSVPIIEMLEKDLKKPVISAIQASMWYSLKTLGIDTNEVKGFGSLFEK